MQQQHQRRRFSWVWAVFTGAVIIGLAILGTDQALTLVDLRAGVLQGVLAAGPLIGSGLGGVALVRVRSRRAAVICLLLAAGFFASAALVPSVAAKVVLALAAGFVLGPVEGVVRAKLKRRFGARADALVQTVVVLMGGLARFPFFFLVVFLGPFFAVALVIALGAPMMGAVPGGDSPADHHDGARGRWTATLLAALYTAALSVPFGLVTSMLAGDSALANFAALGFLLAGGLVPGFVAIANRSRDRGRFVWIPIAPTVTLIVGLVLVVSGAHVPGYILVYLGQVLAVVTTITFASSEAQTHVVIACIKFAIALGIIVGSVFLFGTGPLTLAATTLTILFAIVPTVLAAAILKHPHDPSVGGLA